MEEGVNLCPKCNSVNCRLASHSRKYEKKTAEQRAEISRLLLGRTLGEQHKLNQLRLRRPPILSAEQVDDLRQNKKLLRRNRDNVS